MPWMVLVLSALLCSFSLAHGEVPGEIDTGLNVLGGGGGPPPSKKPADIYKSIYRKWDGSMAELERAMRPNRNYIFWINVPALHPMDLRTSEFFRRWMLPIKFEELSISHNMVAWRCQNAAGKMVMGATGMTGQGEKQETKMFLNGYGLSVFFSVFTDGHLNSLAEVNAYLDANVRRRGAVFAGYEVTTSQCEAMQGFLRKFVEHPRQPFTRFGLTPDPEKMEGGGCVTFASALLKKAGLLTPVVPQFYRTVQAAKRLMGGNLQAPPMAEPPVLPWLKGKTHATSFRSLYYNRWNEESPDFRGYHPLRVMDPEKMTYSLKQFAAVYLDTLPKAMREKEARRFSRGPLGQRMVVSLNNIGTPSGEAERRVYAINDRFDNEMGKIGAVSRAWYREKAKEGFRFRSTEAMGMPVLLLERD